MRKSWVCIWSVISLPFRHGSLFCIWKTSISCVFSIRVSFLFCHPSAWWKLLIFTADHSDLDYEVMVWERGRRIGLDLSCLELSQVKSNSYSWLGMISQWQPNSWALSQWGTSCARWVFQLMTPKRGQFSPLEISLLRDWLCIQNDAMVPPKRLMRAGLFNFWWAKMSYRIAYSYRREEGLQQYWGRLE